MGTSSNVNENINENKNSFEKLIKELKEIPNDQYSCLECNLTPEILKINFNKGIIEFKCPNHGNKNISIKKYFQNQIKYLYYNYECEIDNLKQKDNINEIFDYCTKCRQCFCRSCSDNHEHKSFLIKVNELNNKCHTHLKEYTKYCKYCNINLCDNDNIYCKHTIKEIERPNDTDIQTLKNKRDILMNNILMEQYLIKLLDTLIMTYEKHPSNYFNNINIRNIAKDINENNMLNEEILLNKINSLENKILNYLNIKLDLQLNGNEIKINLNNKNVGNIELNLLNSVEFKYLEEINLRNNNISSIDFLKDFKNLKKIDLSFNKITDIQSLKGILEQNSKMENINLSNNLIKKVNIDELKENAYQRLKEINLDNNKIIEKDFEEIRKIIGYILKYQINKSHNRIRIFGDKFVINNKNNCKLIINNEEKELCQYYEYNEDENIDDILVVKLFINKNLTDMGFMFYKCNSLFYISDISKWNTNKVNNFRYMFSKCSLLSSLPDISQWNTSKVNNVEGIFSHCSLLSSLPDISKWDISKVTDMSYMFFECESLKSLPDLSKWNTSNVIEMFNVFSGCSSLLSLPDLSKWDVQNVTNLSYMFEGCSSLLSVSNISKWNTSNVTDISGMFSGCTELREIPDISKWNISKVKNMSYLFKQCKSLKTIPAIESWNISKSIKTDEMFEGVSKHLIPSKFK